MLIQIESDWVDADCVAAITIMRSYRADERSPELIEVYNVKVALTTGESLEYSYDEEDDAISRRELFARSINEAKRKP